MGDELYCYVSGAFAKRALYLTIDLFPYLTTTTITDLQPVAQVLVVIIYLVDRAQAFKIH